MPADPAARRIRHDDGGQRRDGRDIARHPEHRVQSGRRRIIKSVPLPGGGWEARAFSTWCPQVLAGIGSLPDTVADRSISDRDAAKAAHRAGSTGCAAKDGDELRLLARKAARWAEDHAIELAAADPATPPQLNDRAADAWSPLLAIADAAGGDWPRRARPQRPALRRGRHRDARDRMLLADIRAAFEAKRTAQRPRPHMKLADRYRQPGPAGVPARFGRPPLGRDQPGPAADKERPRGRLRPFHISPITIQLGDRPGRPNGQGLLPEARSRTRLPDIFRHYPLILADQTVTPSESAENKGFQADSEPLHADGCDGLKTPENPSNSAKYNGLTVQNDENEGGARRYTEAGVRAPNVTAERGSGDGPQGQRARRAERHAVPTRWTISTPRSSPTRG